MAQAIQHLLDIGAIEKVPESHTSKGMYSNLSLVPKKNGDVRAILDMKWLNKRIRKRKFKMETLRSIISAVQRGDFMASIDLSEAYLHIPILLSHRQYLCFCYNQQKFQYRALPFGLKSAPRVFTKVLVALIS